MLQLIVIVMLNVEKFDNNKWIDTKPLFIDHLGRDLVEYIDSKQYLLCDDDGNPIIYKDGKPTSIRYKPINKQTPSLYTLWLYSLLTLILILFVFSKIIEDSDNKLLYDESLDIINNIDDINLHYILKKKLNNVTHLI